MCGVERYEKAKLEAGILTGAAQIAFRFPVLILGQELGKTYFGWHGGPQGNRLRFGNLVLMRLLRK